MQHNLWLYVNRNLILDQSDYLLVILHNLILATIYIDLVS